MNLLTKMCLIQVLTWRVVFDTVELEVAWKGGRGSGDGGGPAQDRVPRSVAEEKTGIGHTGIFVGRAVQVAGVVERRIRFTDEFDQTLKFLVVGDVPRFEQSKVQIHVIVHIGRTE